MSRVSPISRSAIVNAAAKDDYLAQAASYSLATLLANDPGSATFYSVSGATYNPLNQTFSVAEGVYNFEYTVRMANGTYSTATVHIDHEINWAELLVNHSFENPVVTGPYQGFTSIPGWTSTGGRLEIVQDGYHGIAGPDGNQWLDTQASPGPVDLRQSVELAAGQTATLSVIIAAQKFLHYQTDPNETLHLVFNGVEIATIKQADLGGYNTFHTLKYEVVGENGPDTLRIYSDGAANWVGFALDAVSLQTSWIVYG